jgi:DNA-directed RNA polymerase subunit M/transcription elongation factor TFIIS
MLVEVKTVASQDFTCPKCQHASLRLHARLPEADGLPEVKCLECPACGEVVVVERPISENGQ